MTVSSKPRKRAVRLTPEALDDLQKALIQRWQVDHRPGRLTREAQSELMGVGIGTAKNMLSGAGADRASFALAFKRLGLPWSDACCVPLVRDPEPVLPEQVVPVPGVWSPDAPITPAPKLWRPTLVMATLTLGVGGASLTGWYRDREWKRESSESAAMGHALYERADYSGAARYAERAFAIAKAHDSADLMAHSTHILGEVAGAQGGLRRARECFDRELAFRRTMSVPQHIPVVLEALGDVETRLGEYAKSRHHLTEAMEDYRLANDPIGVALIQRDLGSVALGTGNLDLADDCLRRSLGTVRGTGRPSIEADVRDRQALVLLARGRASEAKTILRTCLAYWMGQRHARWIALMELHLGRAEARLNDPSARMRIARSRDAFRRVGDEARVAEADSDLLRLSAQSAGRTVPISKGREAPRTIEPSTSAELGRKA